MSKLAHSFQLVFLLLILILSVASFYLLYGKDDREKAEEDKHFIEELYVQDNIVLAVSCDGLPFHLQELNTDSPRLICCYSSQSCGTCVDYAKKRLKDSFPDADKDSTVFYVVTNYKGNEKFSDKNTISIGRRKLDLWIDDANIVCYFVAYKGVVQHFFIPEKNYGKYTDAYLEEIKKRYFPKLGIH